MLSKSFLNTVLPAYMSAAGFSWGIICTFIQQPAAITAIDSLPSLLCLQVETDIQLAVAMVNDKQLLIIANMRPVSLLQHLQAA